MLTGLMIHSFNSRFKFDRGIRCYLCLITHLANFSFLSCLLPCSFNNHVLLIDVNQTFQSLYFCSDNFSLFIYTNISCYHLFSSAAAHARLIVHRNHNIISTIKGQTFPDQDTFILTKNIFPLLEI